MKIEAFRGVKNGSFIHNLFSISLATVISQVIPIILQPILRRQFLPEDFGVFSIYTSIIGVTSIFFTLRYEQIICSPKNPIIAINIFIVSIISSLFFAVLLFIFILIFHTSILSILNISHDNGLFLYFIPLSSLFFAVFNSIYYLLIRYKEFRIAALNKIYRRTSEGFANVSLGVIGVHSGLIFGDLLGGLLNVMSGCFRLSKLNINFSSKISKKRIGYAFRRYIDMPKFNTVPALMNSICLFLPNIFINKFYNTDISGFYSLTFIVLNIPIVFIGKALSDIFIQRFSEQKNSNVYVLKDFFRVSKILFIISILMIVTFSIGGPFLFRIIFGYQWEISGEYAQIFVWLAAIRLIVSPFNIVFVVFNRVKLFALWQFGFFVATLSLYLFNYLEVKHFMILIVVINSMFYILNYFLITHVLRGYEVKIVENK